MEYQGRENVNIPFPACTADVWPDGPVADVWH